MTGTGAYACVLVVFSGFNRSFSRLVWLRTWMFVCRVMGNVRRSLETIENFFEARQNLQLLSAELRETTAYGVRRIKCIPDYFQIEL